MNSTDLTVAILKKVRDETRANRAELAAHRTELSAQLREMQGQNNQRFEVIETSLRDLAQQMVMLARGIKTALESAEP